MNVLELVQNHGTANPFIIAEQLGIDYEYVDFPPRLKGQVITDVEGAAVILLNAELIDSPFRYTVMAHELKHAMDHMEFPTLYAFSYGGKGKFEREADLFASKLMFYLYQEQYMELPETFDRLHQAYGVKEDTAEYIIGGE